MSDWGGPRRHKIYPYSLGLLVMFGSVAMVMVAYLFIIQTGIEIVADTLCPVDGPRERTVVLIDVSSPMTYKQRKEVRQELMRVKANVKPFGAIDLYAIVPDDDVQVKRVLELCNPGPKEEIGNLVGAPPDAEQIWRQRFEIGISEVLLDRSSLAEKSPIVESITSVIESDFLENKAEIRKKLVLVSDMLQHTNSFSHYTGPLDFDKLRNSPFYESLKVGLKGVSVEILYLLRSDQRQTLQGENHIGPWLSFIDDYSGIVTHVTPIRP